MFVHRVIYHKIDFMVWPTFNGVKTWGIACSIDNDVYFEQFEF